MRPPPQGLAQRHPRRRARHRSPQAPRRRARPLASRLHAGGRRGRRVARLAADPQSRHVARRAGSLPQAGFTLLELLVSLAIVAILVLAQVAPFQRAIAARDRAEQVMERTAAARVTLQRLAEEIAGAIPRKGRRFTLAHRGQGRPSSELAFSTTAARRVRRGVQDPVETVRYRLEPAGTGEPAGRGAHLVREQLPSVAAPGTPPSSAVVLEGVEAFRVRVLPSGSPNWLETWRGGDAGQARDLPRGVEIELGLAADGAEPAPLRLVVGLPLGPRS